MTKARHPALLATACLFACSVTEGGVQDRPPVAMVSVQPPLTQIEGTAYELAASTPLPEATPEDHASLHNVFRLSPNIISGSEPHGEDAFRILQEKGVRTILSVDGKVPDAAMAEKYGMRYVHVPIQYKGITDEEVARIAKTFRELEGPFFVHCFHGKHRGPAAAAVGRVVLDGVERDRAIAEMQQWCGTSRSYEGLYLTIATKQMPSAEDSQRYDWDFPAAAPLEGVAGSMVPVARHFDHLKALAKNQWTPDASHPDVNAVHEAAQLEALFARTVALEEMQEYPEDFQQWMVDARDCSAALKSTLMGVQQGTAQMAAADEALTALKRTCQACHDEFRNL